MNLIDSVNVKFLGFSEKDISILSKTFQLSLSRENKRSYIVNNSSDAQSIDMVIINTRSISAIEQFNELQNENPFLGVVTAGPQKSHFHLSGILIPFSIFKILDAVPVSEASGKTTQKQASISDSQSDQKDIPEKAPAEVKDTKPESNRAETLSQPQDKYQVLVVDDSKTMQKAVAIEINNILHDINIDFADSGEDALDLVNQNQYDLIFLDIMMPGIDGFETCKIIRKKESMKKTPIMMLTGKRTELDELKGVLSGCTTYLTKPIKPGQFKMLQLPHLVALSRKCSERQKLKPAEPVKEAVQKTEYQVLVVDDSEIMQKALEVELVQVKDSIMNINFAESGEMALERVDAKKYDLIFLDVMMPGIDGFETCTLMRKITDLKKTPIIMVTGKTSPLDEVKGIMAGCTTYLTKPLNHIGFQEMMEKVSVWLEKQTGDFSEMRQEADDFI